MYSSMWNFIGIQLRMRYPLQAFIVLLLQKAAPRRRSKGDAKMAYLFSYLNQISNLQQVMTHFRPAGTNIESAAYYAMAIAYCF